jgi:hypothetical protein
VEVGFEVLTAVVMKSSISALLQSSLDTCFHAGFLPGVFFDPEDGGNMFLRNVSCISTNYMALYLRR